MNIRQSQLPIAMLERIDDPCADFEKAWQSGERPSIKNAMPDDLTGKPRDALLAELIALDIDYRKRRYETPIQQDYAERFPDANTLIAELFGASERSGRPFQPASIARVAELFPSLKIIEMLGAGGMGVVYKARQEGLDRVVALKILPSEFATLLPPANCRPSNRSRSCLSCATRCNTPTKTESFTATSSPKTFC